MIRTAFLLLAAFLTISPLHADSVDTGERTVTQLADGVYTIRHPDAPDQFPQSNTTVIIGERNVLVVDSCYFPGTAREDIAQIRKWTDKPVRYLVNTHWHYDHTMGNGVYAQEFPGIDIIAHHDTRSHIAGYNPGWFERYPQRTVTFRQQLDSGKDSEGNPLSEEDRKTLGDRIKGRAVVAPEFAALKDFPPNVGFDDELNIDLGNREVRIVYLGRGNTSGDAIVFLPEEKIVIAGDLLDHPVPYLGGGYPVDLARTLRKMEQLDFDTIVPGHGDVVKGKAYLNDVASFIETVVREVEKAVYKVGNGSRNLDAVRTMVDEAVDLEPWRQKFGGDRKENREFLESFSYPGVVTAAYAQLWGK